MTPSEYTQSIYGRQWGGWAPGAEERMKAFYSYKKPKTGTSTGWQYPGPKVTTTAKTKKKKPKFGEVGTLTKEQSAILQELMGARTPTYAPITAGAEAGGWSGPQPTYAPMAMAGSAERQATLSRMMAASPEEEAAAIKAMSAPAMRQFREEILPGIREGEAATGTTWSTMRAGEEAKAGAGLAESLASLGEQYRLQRRSQAMQAAGLGLAEAQAPVSAGLQRYGLEMPSYLKAQQLGMEGALQAQQLTASAAENRRKLLAQMMGIPMMSIYSY